MAQKFVGFKPETIQKKILPALGYNGPTDEKSINLFLASNPAAAAKMGKYTMAARQMVEGKPINANRGLNAIQRFQAGTYGGSQQDAIREFSRSIGREDPRPAPAPAPVYTAPAPVYTAPVAPVTSGNYSGPSYYGHPLVSAPMPE